MKLNLILIITLFNSAIISYLLFREQDSPRTEIAPPKRTLTPIKAEAKEEKEPSLSHSPKSIENKATQEADEIQDQKEKEHADIKLENNVPHVIGKDVELEEPISEEDLFHSNSDNEEEFEAEKKMKQKYYETLKVKKLKYLQKNINDMKKLMETEAETAEQKAEMQEYIDKLKREYEDVDLNGVAPQLPSQDQ